MPMVLLVAVIMQSFKVWAEHTLSHYTRAFNEEFTHKLY